ncbi:hypothetical protein PUN28_015752 [Cardiocondyla obscurior]|uniref:Uncharacterized protein n=1 Tax=Cardiocondyla obscurior TaxID=286306 RepID=A0AAW2EYB7_9HYME
MSKRTGRPTIRSSRSEGGETAMKIKPADLYVVGPPPPPPPSSPPRAASVIPPEVVINGSSSSNGVVTVGLSSTVGTKI